MRGKTMKEQKLIEPEEIDYKTINPSKLRDLVMSMYDIQHARIIIGNRFKFSKDNAGWPFYIALRKAEDEVKENTSKMVVAYPIHLWLVKRMGIKEDMAAQMVGLIQDISKFDNISSLHSYCGYGVIKLCNKCNKKYIEPEHRPAWIAHVAARLKEQFDKKKGKKGKAPDFVENATKMLCSHDNPETRNVAQRKVKGTLLDYNPVLKSLIWRYSTQFVKQGKKDVYRPMYDEFKDYYTNRPDLKAEIDNKAGVETKYGIVTGRGHVDSMAKRKMIKIFLSHMWTVWRELEGLPITKPWIIGVGGHSKYIEAPGPTVDEIRRGMKELEEQDKEEELKALEKLEKIENQNESNKSKKPKKSKKTKEPDPLEFMTVDDDDTSGFGQLVE